MFLSSIKLSGGKYLFLSVLCLSFLVPLKADPRYRPPSTPDEVLQNDRDLEDLINRSIDDIVIATASIPAGATNYIQNTGTYQTDAQFSVSTGTQRYSKTTQALSGGNVSLDLTNTSNTAGSQAVQLVGVGGSTAGDPFINFNVSGVQNWSLGIDNSDGDTFKLSASGALGTTDLIRAAPAGEINYPLQPSFSLRNSARIENQTGDGTDYPIDWNTEVFDQGSDVSGSTFTAPVAGKYPLCANFVFSSLGTAHTAGVISIVTSNRSYQPEYSTTSMPFSRYPFGLCVNADMDAGDIAVVRAFASGSTKTVDIESGASFTGYLAN